MAKKPSITHHSYVVQSDYEIYVKDQKKQRETILRLESNYSSLAYSHKELRNLDKKIKMRER